MVCLYCGGETAVTNSRHQKRLNHVWRRRQCVKCQAVFSSLEQADLYKSLAVSSLDHLEPFSRDRLFVSLYDSLRHRKSALRDATALTDTVIAKLSRHVAHGAVPRLSIILTAQEVLKHFDRAAATAYTAYHPLEISEQAK